MNTAAAKDGVGNTPTGVGKTSGCDRQEYRQGKHPHGRGEDSVAHARYEDEAETPPRAWGRPPSCLSRWRQWGNTPTGVGKTPTHWPSLSGTRKHPHGRGEDARISSQVATAMETPPRAWGRPRSDRRIRVCWGNTPTGVGKTGATSQTRRPRAKHPHGRGEDLSGFSFCRGNMETPPRAWGRLLGCLHHTRVHRNTPTGVGKTPPWPSRLAPTGKHPHGRGEDFSKHQGGSE